MTRRTHSATRRNSSMAPNTSSGTPRADVLEERVVAFAEQLGRIAGTVQAKTPGWMDGDALKKELARVRDGAADLLQQLTADAQEVGENRPTAGAAPRRSRGRSGGIVDAPGKKHRPPMPTDRGANRADSQAAKCAPRRRWSRHPGDAGAARVSVSRPRSNAYQLAYIRRESSVVVAYDSERRSNVSWEPL